MNDTPPNVPLLPSTALADGLPQRMLHDDDTLTISALPGGSRRLFVAFTGVGLGLGSIQRQEFAGVGWAGGVHHAVFVIDRGRTWYSRPGLAERIVDTVTAHARDVGCTEIVTLGNSMGGFGAVLFADPLGANAAIAFGAQFSVHPDREPPPRPMQYRRALDPAALCDADAWYRGGARVAAIFGEDLATWHEEMFRSMPGAEVLRGPGGHDVARRLKAAGILQELIALLADGRIAEARSLVEARRAPPLPQMHAMEHGT